MEGIVETGVVLCPILSMSPHMANSIEFEDPIDSSRQTNCIPFISEGRCGRFDGRFMSTQPRCPFAVMMESLVEDYGQYLEFEGAAE
jgi:hypothetical protein